MSLLSRLSTLLRIRAHSTLDKLEDPGQVMDYSYHTLLKQLEQLRRSIVEVVTNEKRLEMQQQELLAKVNKLSLQAGAALEAKREDLARLALQKKETLLLQLAGYEQQIAQLRTQEEKLVDMERTVSTRIETFRVQKEMIKAQYSAAQAQVKIHETMTGISSEMTEIHEAMQRTQDKVLTMQARASAMESLIAEGSLDEIALPGTGQDRLDRELQQIAAQQNVEAQLQMLKQQLQLGGPNTQQKQIEGPAIE
jgi:phage shock protein A